MKLSLMLSNYNFESTLLRNNTIKLQTRAVSNVSQSIYVRYCDIYIFIHLRIEKAAWDFVLKNFFLHC